VELLTETKIRNFRICGNYLNERSLALGSTPHVCDEGITADNRGFLPPVVEYETEDGAKNRIVISGVDIPILCLPSFDEARTHLALILNAREGDLDARRQLALRAERPQGAVPVSATESEYVVPSTSSESHSEQDISEKGFTLLKLTQLGYPVPDFTVLTTQAYAERNHQLEELLSNAIRQLEILTRQSVEGEHEPLVFAMRCATAHYIPGLLDTYLNVGITTRALPSVERMYGKIAAHKMFLNNLKNICHCLDPDKFAAISNMIIPDLPDDKVLRLTDTLCDIISKKDRALIEDPLHQATFMARQCYQHFEENLNLVMTLCRGSEHYPSIILQKMICSVRHDRAYVGVLNSRNTRTGLGMELHTGHNMFGEEMMTGTSEFRSSVFEDREAIRDEFPAVHHFVPSLGELEEQFESPVTIEFAVEATSRYQLFALLQLNRTAMSGQAALIATVDMHKAGTISRQRVTELIRPYHIKQLISNTVDSENLRELKPFCFGFPVLPQTAVSAQVYFTSSAALSAKSRGKKVCLCKKTFLPTDSAIMREMDAIISMSWAAVHVVTICHGLGIPALLNLEKNGVRLLPEGGLVNAQGTVIKEGDWITLSSRKSTIFEGEAQSSHDKLLQPEGLTGYMKGELRDLDEEERKSYALLSYAFRYYQQLSHGIEFDQTSTLGEVLRLVNFELRSSPDEARQLVNGWYDNHASLYMEEVLKSDIGDHLSQSNAFEMLTLDRKIKFFKEALAKCCRDHISGYAAGAFMLGRYLSQRYSVAFWKALTPAEIGLCVNEWVLFEKYMQVLHDVGEREVVLARKQILTKGLGDIHLHEGRLHNFITLKLSGVTLQEAKDSLPSWSDPQSAHVLELLQHPYRAFFDFQAPWSIKRLEKICSEEDLPLPGPDDI
jgi:pyruvate,orthophosphate dikinase